MKIKLSTALNVTALVLFWYTQNIYAFVGLVVLLVAEMIWDAYVYEQKKNNPIFQLAISLGNIEAAQSMLTNNFPTIVITLTRLTMYVWAFIEFVTISFKA